MLGCYTRQILTYIDNVVDLRLPGFHVEALHDCDELAAGDSPAAVTVEEVEGLLELVDLPVGQTLLQFESFFLKHLEQNKR